MATLLPYGLTAVVLAFLFTSLSASVVDERLRFTGAAWFELRSLGLRSGSVRVFSADRSTELCSARGAAKVALEGCPSGGDYELREEAAGRPAALRRTPGSRLADGARVSVDYQKGLRVADVAGMLGRSDLSLFVAFMGLHWLVFLIGDLLSFGYAYRAFNAPDVSWRELLECRGGPCAIQVLMAPAAEALYPLYMWRVKGAPIAEIVGSNVWVAMLDLAAICTPITAVLLYDGFVRDVVPAVGAEWLWAIGAFWSLFFANLAFWRGPLCQRISDAAARGELSARGGTARVLAAALRALRTFRRAGWQHCLRVYVVRMLVLASTVASSYAALHAVGVWPPAPIALVAIPLVVLSIFTPISVGGYGGPQLVAWFLLVQVGGCGSAEQVLAFSILWSTGFAVGRASIGALLFGRFWRSIVSRDGTPADAAPGAPRWSAGLRAPSDPERPECCADPRAPNADVCTVGAPLAAPGLRAAQGGCEGRPLRSLRVGTLPALAWIGSRAGRRGGRSRR